MMRFLTDRLSSLRHTGRALRYPNFRLFVMGQGISLIGTWMQRMALQWFVYDWTHNPWLLGALDFAGQIPAFVIAPWAGLLADHVNRHRLIVLTQTAAMLQAALLAALVLSGLVQVWHLFALAILLGCINGFDIPVRQSFVAEMVDDHADLGNAIALNSSVFNTARLIGPSIAGFILAVTSAGMCFLLNAVSYLAVIWALLRMKIKRVAVPGNRPRPGLSGLHEGLRYVWGFRTMGYLLLNLTFISVAGTPYMTLLPVFAKHVLRGGPQTLGLLIAAVGVGALCGAFYLASRRTVRGLGRVMAVAMAFYSLGLIAFAYSRWIPVSMLIMLFTGVGMMTLMAGTNTLLQTLVDEDKRGRVMALYTMAFMGSGPLGSLWAGAAATHIGAPLTVFIGGLVCLLTTALFIARLPVMRREAGPLLEARGHLPRGQSSSDVLS